MRPDGAGAARAAVDLRDAEIKDLDPLTTWQGRVGHEEQVLGLQITVHDAGSMRSCQRRTRLRCDLKDLRQGQPANVGQALLQRHALEKLHEDVGCAFGRHAGIEHLDDVGMANGTGSSCLVEESPYRFPILGQGQVQDFDGCRAFDEWILGKVDLAETARAEQLNDAVVSEELARLQHLWNSGRRLRSSVRLRRFLSETNANSLLLAWS